MAVLEGGYHVAGLTKSVKAVLEEMLDETHFSEEKLSSLERKPMKKPNQVIKQVISED